MALDIETYSNVTGGHPLFKALGHPLAAPRARALVRRLESGGPVAVYDPFGHAGALATLYDLGRVPLAGVFVQDLADVGNERLGMKAQPATALADVQAAHVLVAAFDAARPLAAVRHLLPKGARLCSFDALRLPDRLCTNPKRYLDPLNFATNFALFRDAPGCHTRLVTANYWAGWGAPDAALWLCLFDARGRVLARWEEPLAPTGVGIEIDSRRVRERFALRDFTGSLFLHAVRIAGHDTIKYALDTFGDDAGAVTCTHDANAWPADRYAGLPAPAPGERVLLWVQNSHPCPIPAGAVGLNVMGSGRVARFARAVPPFGTVAVDVAGLLPRAAWPHQIEIRAGRHFVRPRYEVLGPAGRSRIAHANVERTDLAPDPRLGDLAPLFGKGHILPAPVLPPERWRTIVLPTPMATDQEVLPLRVALYDPAGREVARRRLGALPRGRCPALDVDDLLADAGGALPDGYGHVELSYDLTPGARTDGWLHALFRYENRESGHAADTSFGAHVYNVPVTWRGEPQSYAGPAPGLSTRLFLRLGPHGTDTLCHLIYPASKPWHPCSDTRLTLVAKDGTEVARRRVRIPCGGSLLWRYSEMFGPKVRRRAGEGAYVVVRDSTCRLFGYHGLLGAAAAFCLDHMFGF